MSYQAIISPNQQRNNDSTYPLKSINNNKETPDRSLNVNTIKKLTSFINNLLSFYAFYHYNKNYCYTESIKPDIVVIKKKIIKMMENIKLVVRRDKNTMGWKISKFHDLLHIDNDMNKFGYNLMNIHTGKGESGLKFWAKKPARKAQKHNQNNFLTQTSQRIFETEVTTKAFSDIFYNSLQPKKTHYNDNFVLKEPLFRFFPGSKTYTGLETKNNKLHPIPKIHLEFHVSILKFLENNALIKEQKYVDIFSSCYRKIDDMTFRAHPNYQKKGPWYDCVSTKWENKKSEIEIPSRCIMFLKINENIHVLCQTCNHQNIHEKKSSNKMFSHWTMSVRTDQHTHLISPNYYLLDIQCINKQEWLVMEHPSLFYQIEKQNINTKIVWIHDIQTNWVEFLQS